MDLEDVRSVSTAAPERDSEQVERQIDPERSHVKRRVRDVMRFASPGRTLDIGCGRGEASIRLSRFGFSCVGLDMSDEVVARLQSAYPEVTWHCGRLEDLVDVLGTFDVVTMYHVLEHIPQPLKFMEVVKSIVNSGGLIVVEVPNVAGLRARRCGSSWDYFYAEHVNYFTMRHLVRMADRLGCEVLRTSGFYHFSHPQDVWWKDVIKSALARVGFKDVISIFMRVNSQAQRR